MKVGVIGLGAIARKHIATIREIDPQTEFIAMRHNINCSSENNIENVYNYDQLLSRTPDFIIISNPTSEHFATIEKLADSNVPLFIEKPLFNTATSPPQVAAPTYIACNLRFLDCLQFIKKEIKGKRINEVNSYCGSYLPDWRPNINWRECYSANKELGGGVHIDLIHEIDYLCQLFGKPQKVHKTFRNASSLDITAWDYANYLLEYKQFSTSVVLNYYRTDYKRTLEILTSNETYFVDLAKNTVLCDGVEVFKSRKTILDTYKDQMLYFIQTLDNASKFNNINEAYEVLKICLE